jgi:hypothetical protein
MPGRPGCGPRLTLTAAATVGFGLVAEPLLRPADRTTMLS